jgi:hypothetical protein
LLIWPVLTAAEGVGDALVGGVDLAVDAMGVHLQQDDDAVPGAAGDFGRGHAGRTGPPIRPTRRSTESAPSPLSPDRRLPDRQVATLPARVRGQRASHLVTAGLIICHEWPDGVTAGSLPSA